MGKGKREGVDILPGVGESRETEWIGEREERHLIYKRKRENGALPEGNGCVERSREE